MAGGCSYLDVDPELGLTQDEVFETYKNYRSYFDWVYESNGGKNMERIHISFPFYYDLFQSRTFSWYQAIPLSAVSPVLESYCPTSSPFPCRPSR